MQHFKLTLTLQSFFLSVFLLLLTHPFYVLAEGTKSIAPSTADEAALFVGAGNTGTRGGDYGLFAWKDSDSKLYFNIQNRCEKVYMGFSIPKNDRSFADLNPVYGGSGIEENLIFRIVDPLGNPINNLSCFGNTTINGEVWQTLNSSTANISNRATADNGPSQLGNAAGYNGFELDLSACGLNLTGNYSIEFYTTNANYNPNTARSGFYIPYFDITVANCTNQGMTGRVWSNNWGIGIKRDGQGSFDRAFNGKLYVCSAEGFITKIDFNTNTNTRAAAGRQTDQRSGFRAGSFNISFNQQGTGATGDVIADRQSLPNVNAPNPELPVFLNLPDEAFCPVRELGDIKAAAEFITGCPQNRCINVAATQPGQFEIVIEGPNGNGILDQPSERRVIYQITEANKVTNPETAGYIYEACIPWDGKDGNGNILLEVAITITGKYFQGIYHFPVYDAEFNDDGFIVETVRPALGRQLLYYDDTKITEVSSSTESKDGTNGCIGPCHRWTGEWENYADKDDNYGNYNTINTWWFASTSSQDFTSNVGGLSPIGITCPADFVGCTSQSTDPSVTGQASTIPNNINCEFVLDYTDVVVTDNCDKKVIERNWFAYLKDLPNNRKTCTQTITLNVPILTNCPSDVVLACADGNTYSWNPPTIAGTCGGTIRQTNGPVSGSTFPTGTTTITYQIEGTCGTAQTCSFTITVNDKGDANDLSISCPADVTGCAGQSTDPSITGTATVSVTNSTCPTTLNYTDVVTDNGCGAKTIKREWIVYFTNKPNERKACTQTITLAAPTLSNCPTDVVLGCTDGNIYSWNAPTVSGTCGGTITQISGPASGSAFPIGTTTVAYQIGTGCANQICSFTVTVNDAGDVNDLSIICPADITRCAGQSTAPSAIGAATVTVSNSNCPTTLIHNDVVTDNGCGAKTIQREWVVYFTHKPTERKTCTQTISITAPTLSDCPADVVLGCADGNIYSWNAPTVNGTCSGTVIQTSGPASGSAFPVGTTTITYQVGEGCANQTCSFTVTVKDAGAPDDLTIICPTVPADATGCIGQSSDPSITGTPNIVNNSSCPTTLDYTDIVTDNGCGAKTITREWVVYFTNNPSIRKTCIQKITLTAPTLSNCPTDVVLNCNDGNTYSWNPPTANGNCGGPVTQTSGPASGSAFPVGTTTITYQVGGGCANQTCSFTVTVKDAGNLDDLTIICPSIPADATGCTSSDPSITGTATVINNSSCPTTLEYTDAVTDDGCGAKTIKREWVVYFTNNPAIRKTCSQVIIITAPTLGSCPADVVLGCEDGNTYSWNAPTINGTCSGTVIRTSGPASGSTFPVGTTTITYQIGDGCANQTCSFTVTVTGAGTPDDLTIICPSIPADVADCTGQSSDPTITGTPTVVNNSSCPTTLEYTDAVTDDGCGAKTIKREWVVYFTNNPAIRKTCSQVIIITAPTLINCPTDVVLNCGDGNTYSWIPPSVPGNCGGPVTQTSGPASGSAFPVGTTTITYQIGDGCTNQTCSFTVTVTGAGTPDDLTIICPSIPADVADCTGQSSDPSITGTPTVVNNSSCPTTLEYTDAVTDNGCGSKTIKREWVVYFTNNPAIRKTCSQVIMITPPTLINCPTDVVLNCGDGNTYSWIPPSVPGNCGGPVTQTSGPASGSAFPVGTTTITYQIGDGCANQTCSFTVTVNGAGDANDLTITCPADVTGCAGQSITPGVTGTATVTVANSNCPTTLGYNDVVTNNGCGAKTIKREWVVYFTNNSAIRKTCTQTITLAAPTLSNCPTDVVLSCEDGNTHSWNAPTVNGNCGGTLTQTSGPASGSSFPIGTTTITYQIGDGCTNQICSFTVTVVDGGGLTTNCPADVVLDCVPEQNGAIYSWETPTASSCCNSCPEPGIDLTDFVYMGILNGHQYYCSKEKADWATAKATCESQGGHLAVINSAEENQMLSAFLKDQSAYIGLSDIQQEGVFEWCNNDPVTYSNWYPGQPDNYGNNQDVTRLFPNGVWDDIAGHYKLEYILEIPCLSIQQCAGPESGSVFPVGTTEVAYHIEDNCGNEEVCTFNVTVNPCDNLVDYCDITGQNTTYFWIRHVVLGAINNPTVANGGYGDFSNLSTNVQAGSEQTIILSPGFARNKYYLNWRVWIDYNRDGDFNDANEELFTIRDYNILKIKFRVPQQCAIGQTRMRVSMKYGNPANHCQDFTYGEVEDYTINLTPATNGLSAMTGTSRSTNEVEVAIIPHESTAPLSNLLPTETPSLTVFPNPVATNLQVQLTDYQQLDGVLKIYNHLGQIVHQELLSRDNKQQVSIAVNHLPDGMYLLSVESDDAAPIVRKFNKH